MCVGRAHQRWVTAAILPHLWGNCGNLAAAFLSTNEGQVALVQAATVVSVDEVDASKLVVDQDLPISNAGDRPSSLNFER